MLKRLSSARPMRWSEGEIRQAPLPDGSNVALYRVDGAIYATADMCTHGEASLAEEGIITGKDRGVHLSLRDVRRHHGRADRHALRDCIENLSRHDRSTSNVQHRGLKMASPSQTVSSLPLQIRAPIARHRTAREPRPNAPRKRARASSRPRRNSFAGAATPAFEPPMSPPKPGLSWGAQLHHFPTKDLLVVATLEYVFEQAQVLSRRRGVRGEPARAT